MKLTNYKFGQVEIDNILYTQDFIICGEDIISNWRRESGHNLSIKDLEKVFEFDPNILIIGTGKSGMMEVSPEIIKEIESRRIEVRFYPTKEAIKIYNKYIEITNILIISGCFHLTC